MGQKKRRSKKYILGLRSGHDAGACLLAGTQIIADISEERLTRVKNDSSFPINAIAEVLKAGKIDSEDLDVVSIPADSLYEDFYNFFKFADGKDKMAYIPRFPRSLIYKNRKRFLLPLYKKLFILKSSCRISLVKHHLAHASAAYYTSPNKNKVQLAFVMDGIGDGESCSIYRCDNENIEKLYSVDGRGSLAWFYGVATEGYGWRHGSDEWKIMGLAPYGTADINKLSNLCPKYGNGRLIQGVEYGPFDRWNDHGANHYHSPLALEFSLVAKKMKAEDYAASVQALAEEQALKFILPWIKSMGIKSAVFAGGFFLNVKLNQKIWELGVLDEQWIYPNPGDSGLSFGAASFAMNEDLNNQNHYDYGDGCFGSSFSNEEIKKILDERRLKYKKSDNTANDVAKLLAKNLVVGWFSGKMETGPRALGHRSILMSPRKIENKDLINKKVKFREAFRPFCPSILENYYDKYLKNYRLERYMVSSFEATELAKKHIPATVHVDGTSRPQLVEKKNNLKYFQLLSAYEKITGVGAIMNTSFNVKGEPIVCNPREAIKCFFDTGLDVLVLEDYILLK